jgi:hypothetical protein
MFDEQLYVSWTNRLFREFGRAAPVLTVYGIPNRDWSIRVRSA